MAIIDPYSLDAVESDKTYPIARAKLWTTLRIALYTLPWIACIIVATILDSQPYPWWLLVVLVTQIIGPVHSDLFRTTASIVLYTDKTISHVNVFGGTISAYNHISLQKFESILLDGKHAIYVKTEKYYNELRDSYGKWNPQRMCCVYKTESYSLADPKAFAKDHGMYPASTADEEGSDTLPKLAANWAKYRIDHRRLSTKWRRDMTTRDRVMNGDKKKSVTTPDNSTV